MVFPKAYKDPSDDELTATRALYDGVPLASKFVRLIERHGLPAIFAIERVTDHRANIVRADHELGLDSSAVVRRMPSLRCSTPVKRCPR
jgi:hypothetical protein